MSGEFANQPEDPVANGAVTCSRAELFKTWLHIGLLSFGGPAAQIALMHRVIVEQRGWLSEKQYLDDLSFCMLLPGPEAMQLASLTGWRTHGVFGGLLAGLCFVIPGALVVGLLAALYTLYGQQAFTDSLFLGVKAAVLVIVADALLKVSRRALADRLDYIIAGSAFVALFFFSVPFPLLVLLAGGLGFWRASRVRAISTSTGSAARVSLASDHLSVTGRTVILWLGIWWLPVLALWLVGGEGLLLAVALFFSKLAVVSFGGAYAVLAYMAQAIVTDYQWLSATQMMDGLGLAETTPGPLILVTQFVGYLTGYEQGGLLLALAAAGVTLWVTFVPCFLWIFAGAPYMLWLGAQPGLTGALRSITAAVVGVILNLALWFALHVIFDEVIASQHGALTVWMPVWSTVNLPVILLSGLSAVLLFRYKQHVITVLVASAVLAFLLSLVTGGPV